MLFNSFQFIYVFLPIAYLVFRALRTKRQRYIWLTATGYVFYGFWNYRFCALMAFSTLVSFFVGRALAGTDDERRRKLWVTLSVSVDLALLGFFKYAGFLLDTTRSGLSLLGLHVQLPALHVVLPIGISFYTFHTISYIVDAYRRKIVPTRDLFEFSCYVSLFSQLVAGPIVRFREIEGDLESIDRRDRAERRTFWGIGWSFFAIGLIKKVLLADGLAAIIDPALAHAETLGTASAWMCMVGYAYQLYFDFSGYSDMAVGLGYLFGIRIPQNFASPYKAVSPSDFWTRWHMSLSSCMRDYVYIPLGGNRQGAAQTYRNLMLTMLIGGLWHGAGWTFVLWGGYHGVLLILHRLIPSWDRLPSAVRRVLMFVLVVVGWVFFRSKNLSMAAALLRTMFSPRWAGWPPGASGLACLLLVAATIAHFGRNTWEMEHRWRPAPAMALGIGVAACLAILYGAEPSPFLYFQF
jgi:alginate O-acetyltransferase complex protein AlgI